MYPAQQQKAASCERSVGTAGVMCGPMADVSKVPLIFTIVDHFRIVPSFLLYLPYAELIANHVIADRDQTCIPFLPRVDATSTAAG